MPPARHGREAVFSKLIATIFWVVVIGVVGVTVLARDGLALRLAIGGALAASVMIWSVYSEALRAARAESGRERTLHARTAADLLTYRRSHGDEVAGLQTEVLRLERELEVARTSAQAHAAGDMWDAADAPTVVDLAHRRESQPFGDEGAHAMHGVAGTA